MSPWRYTPRLAETPGQPLWRNTSDAIEAMPHQARDTVVAACARPDLFAKRRSLMEQWEAWCVGRYPPLTQENEGRRYTLQ